MATEWQIHSFHPEWRPADLEDWEDPSFRVVTWEGEVVEVLPGDQPELVQLVIELTDPRLRVVFGGADAGDEGTTDTEPYDYEDVMDDEAEEAEEEWDEGDEEEEEDDDDEANTR